jgi:hypothetical protein
MQKGAENPETIANFQVEDKTCRRRRRRRMVSTKPSADYVTPGKNT